ncbi:hypothetical protein FF011L_36340 [Roseimaritima multifibrata]|uniref:Uncharacterized protein n=1 Tax=Roseimaritima multifibrata TaxID=1930274 RepID=A0A517MIY7_9BACT|nr:hypothetical protein FF011L_36340 [Roseimaritima multifibrata]
MDEARATGGAFVNSTGSRQRKQHRVALDIDVSRPPVGETS